MSFPAYTEYFPFIRHCGMQVEETGKDYDLYHVRNALEKRKL